MCDKSKIKKIKDTKEDESQKYICSWCWQNGLIPVGNQNGVNLGGVISLFKANGLSVQALKGINAKQIALLKKEGMHVGFPDMSVFGNSINGQNMLLLENKVKNNKPSEIQLACHAWLRAIGFTVEVSKNSIDAIQKIKNFFGTIEQPENIEYLQIRKEILNNKERGAK